MPDAINAIIQDQIIPQMFALNHLIVGGSFSFLPDAWEKSEE